MKTDWMSCAVQTNCLDTKTSYINVMKYKDSEAKHWSFCKILFSFITFVQFINFSEPE